MPAGNLVLDDLQIYTGIVHLCPHFAELQTVGLAHLWRPHEDMINISTSACSNMAFVAQLHHLRKRIYGTLLCPPDTALINLECRHLLEWRTAASIIDCCGQTTSDWDHWWRRKRRRRSTASIQPAKAYEDESVMGSGPH